jgi:hypothetical protein
MWLVARYAAPKASADELAEERGLQLSNSNLGRRALAVFRQIAE